MSNNKWIITVIVLLNYIGFYGKFQLNAQHFKVFRDNSGLYGIATLNDSALFAPNFSEILVIENQGNLFAARASKDHINSESDIDTLKWGLINVLGKFSISPKYDAPPIYHEGFYYFLTQGCKIDIVDSLGAIYKMENLEEILSGFSGDNIFTKNMNDLFSINYHGKYEKSSLIPVSLTTAIILSEKKYGMIDLLDSILVPIVYTSYKIYNNSFISLEKNDTLELFSLAGIKIDTHQFVKIIKDNLFYIVKVDNSRYGIVSKHGKMIHDPTIEEVVYSHKNHMRIRYNGKYTIIDSLAKMLVPPIFDNIYHFTGLSFCGQIGDKWNLFNLQGIKINKDSVLQFYYFGFTDKNYSLIAYFDSTAKVGFFNRLGEVVVAPKYDYVMECHADLYRVFLEKKINYLNPKGQLISSLWFDEAGPIYGDIALVKIGNKSLLIDTLGNILFQEFNYQDIRLFNLDRAAIQMEEKWGFINRVGEIVIPCIYDEVEDFNDMFRQARVRKNKEWLTIDVSGRILNK